MLKVVNKKTFIIFSLVLVCINFAKAAFLSNGFVVTSGLYNISLNLQDTSQCSNDKSTAKSCLCNIQIFYPKISYSNKIIEKRLNDTIIDFVHSFKSCEKNSLEVLQKIVNYQFPDSGYKDYFSIKFMKKEGEVIRKQYSLNFSKKTGQLLDFTEIFSETNQLQDFLLKNFVDLVPEQNNKIFFDYIKNNIKSNQIQFYVENGLFHIVMNNKKLNSDARTIDIVVPKNFLKV
jgi:hypothetical protein